MCRFGRLISAQSHLISFERIYRFYPGHLLSFLLLVPLGNATRLVQVPDEPLLRSNMPKTSLMLSAGLPH